MNNLEGKMCNTKPPENLNRSRNRKTDMGEKFDVIIIVAVASLCAFSPSLSGERKEKKLKLWNGAEEKFGESELSKSYLMSVISWTILKKCLWHFSPSFLAPLFQSLRQRRCGRCRQKCRHRCYNWYLAHDQYSQFANGTMLPQRNKKNK